MKSKRRITITLIVAAVLLLSVSWLSSSQQIAKETDLRCTACHDKPGSKLLTDQGKYWESMRTLDGYDQIKASFGKCTACHVRKPGSEKLTKQGKELASVVESMAELREWLEQNHPATSPEP